MLGKVAISFKHAYIELVHEFSGGKVERFPGSELENDNSVLRFEQFKVLIVGN